MDWTMPLDPVDRERLAVLRRQFTACRNEIAKQRRNADAVASAVATHLAQTTTADLPPRAQSIWMDHVARLLKGDPAKPLQTRAIDAIRSWPSARVVAFVKALTDIEAILVDTENDALNEAIYAEISRAYS